MNRKKAFVCLAGLVCASALAVDLMAEGPQPDPMIEGTVIEPLPDAPSPPQAASLSDAGVAQGPANTDIIPMKGATHNTQSMMAAPKNPQMVALNVGGLAPWTPPQGGHNPAVSGDRALEFDLSPGTGPPPDTLGSYPMTPFEQDDRPLYEVVTTVPSPCPIGGDIEFSIPMSHRRIGQGWWTWSHGYTGDVYFTTGAASVTITLPQPACAFYFYVEPNAFSSKAFTAVASDGASSGSFWAEGSSGATYVGVFGEGLEWVTISTDDGVSDFAVGEFAIGCSCDPVYVACCDEETGACTDGLDLLDCADLGWRWEMDISSCGLLDPPCGWLTGACCVGPAGEPPYDPYECIGDMAMSDCLFAGEETIWYPDQTCEGAPPFDCEAPTYCDGSGGCVEYISRVLLPYDGGTIDNETGCTQYGDYTDTVALMSIGLSYDLSVWNGYVYSGDETIVWIDWNGDKDWYDDGEFIGTVVGQPQSDFVILVPPMAIPGYTRMRIRIDRYPPAPPPYEPCGSTTHGEVEDYTILVSGEMPTGACCDPYTGDCADDVESPDCLPPLQFHWEQTCAGLDPPCGNPGSCCDDIGDACTDGVLELNCAGTRFAPLPATCDDFDPPCGFISPIFVFDPGTDPPPEELCEYPMTPFPLDDSSAVYDDVTDVPSPCPTGGAIEFSIPVSHRRIGSGWMTWSHGYTGDVYYSNEETEVTITLPQPACAFYFYVEPNPFAEHTFKLIANGVIESEEFTAHGSAGAAYAGVCATGLETVTVQCTSGADFAIGEFGIACFCEPIYAACCHELTGACTDGLDVLTCIERDWRWDVGVEFCADLDPACGEVTGACCVGPAGEPPYDPYECIADMTESDCLAAGEETFWAEGESCEGASPYGCGAPGLLYAPTQPDNPAFRAAIEELIGKTCDYFDPRYATPTLEELQEYIAVFTWVNYAYADKVAMGDVLADYVDAGGVVILGQWCLPTAGNYLSGRIMEEYCPATASSYAPDSYAGDGYQCPTWDVDSFSSSYFDQVTAAPGAFHDGTTDNGSDFVCYWPLMYVSYSPGNTGLDYTAGDAIQLIANMYTCGAYWRTACCHPTEYDPATGAGVCEHHVYPMDCLPPLELHWEQTCASLHPPCGNPGACCDIFTGECSDPVLELNCEYDRFEPGQQCAELEPVCGNPGCCCIDDESPVPFEEYQANCQGRFLPGLLGEDCVAEAFDPPCGEWECSGILYAPSHPDNPTWRAQVAALCDCNVDYWDARISTPTLEDLRDYCCVFTWANYAYADAILFGNTLAAYVDAGGRVILGQWTFEAFSGTPGAGGSVIVEPEYCPVTVSYWSSATYAGDGTDCVHILGPVSEYASSYCDQASPRPGAVTDGTFLESGLPAVIWRADRHLYYSPGNTGGDYTTGDTAQLVANMCACTGELLEGACCDPTDGACTNGVVAADCMPPLEFHCQETCETLDPPCGNPGCCCADHPPAEEPPPGEAWQELEVNCEEGRFLPGVLGEDCHLEAFTPPCGEYEACEHSITMWDDYGDGWNGGYIDVYVDGDLVLAGVTLASGSGPDAVYFEASTCDTIETVWTPGGWPYEASYCIYGALGEICCDGVGGVEPSGVTCTGNCGQPTGACCLGYEGCVVLADDDCVGDWLGACTDCVDMNDCDGDGMTDLCAIEAYETGDCNYNGIPDNCDLAAGTSADCQDDGVPDECQLNERPFCCGDGYCSPAEDCETCEEDCGECPYCGDGICQPEAGETTETCPEDCVCPECADFCVAAPGVFPGDTCGAGNDCDHRASEDQVIQVTIPEDGMWVFSLCEDIYYYDTYLFLDAGCCEDTIDYDDDGPGDCGLQSQITQQLDAGIYYLVIEAYGSTACGVYNLDVYMLGGGSGDCCFDHYPEPGCDDPVCEESVCSYDPFCCDYGWDSICADEAMEDPLCDCGGGRDLELLISQLPGQSDGIFADCDCDFCTSDAQVAAENFVLPEETDILTIRFWGGMYPSDHEPANEWNVTFYEDSGGVPGAEIASYSGAALQEQTGVTLFAVHEWVVSFTLSPPLNLAAGTYHVAAYANSVGDTDSWFWEVGDFDSQAGVTGQAYGSVCPAEFPYYDSAIDMAFELYGLSGPPINDCNENGVPDDCDLDCNNNCIPDDCEEGPVTCGDLDLKPGSCPNSFNRGSHGVLPVALMGTEDIDEYGLGKVFDLSQVDISSIRLSRPAPEPCEHCITMWDDWGNGWIGWTSDSFVDVYVDGDLVLAGVTLASGTGPETVCFEADTGSTIQTAWTSGYAWAEECSYCIYDGFGDELGCDGLGGAVPTGITVTGNCPGGGGGGVGGEVAPHEGPPGPHTVFEDVATPFVEAIECECADLNGDGIDDISMKFETDEVVPGLALDELPAGALVPVVITGCMAGTDQCFTTPVDCLRLVPPGSGGASLTVEASMPGVWVDVSPPDLTLDSGGFADFVRMFPETSVVTLTAEESFEGQPLRGWQIGGLLHDMGETTVEVTIDQDMTVRAVYGSTPGSVSPRPDPTAPESFIQEETAPGAGTIEGP